MPLEPFLTKNLLQDIEASGWTRKEFNLLAYLDSKQDTYGTRFSTNPRRREAQKKFDQLKRKTPVSYQKILDKLGVNSGEALKREIRSFDSSVSPTPSGTSDSDGEDDRESDEESTAKPWQPPSKPPSFKPIKTPPPKIASMDELTAQMANLRMPVKEVSFPGVTATMSSTGSYAPSTVPSTEYVLNQVDVLANMKMDGSVDYPYIIHVDQSKPEANWGFDVVFVQNVEVRNFQRDVFHIRKVTGVEQAEEWSAIIPSKKYPTLANRAVLISGPSQDYWHQDAQRYHQPPSDKKVCEPTKKAHMVLQTNIHDSKDRMYSHWLLVFPPGTEMENHVMSDDAVHVKSEVFELYSQFETFDPEKKKSDTLDLYGLDVHWRIAVKGGQMLSSPNGTGKIKRRFAKRKA
jgi:hypothetical protein